jgi:hypothetical protein
MAEKPATRADLERLTTELKDRLERERAAGAYADDLSDVELPKPQTGATAREPIVQGFDLAGESARVRFRPELGFSSKPVVGPAITLVKRFILRLQLFVLDDLAQQADAGIRRVEAALAVEVATRERLERDLRELEARVARLERESNSPRAN